MAPNIPAVQPPTMGVLCHFFEEAAALVTGAAGAEFDGRAAMLTPAGTARWGQGSIYQKVHSTSY